MACKFVIDKPSTIYLKNVKPCNRLNVFLSNSKVTDMLYFFREINNRYDNIDFNLCHAGTYYCTHGEVEKIVPIEIHSLKVSLPEKQRNRWGDFKIIYNPDFTNGPARNFTLKKIIETGPLYKEQPFPIRLFILLHECGHFYYKDEDFADLWAAKTFIDMGYNNSSALYALTKVLNFKSKKNEERIMKLFNSLNKQK